MTDVEVTLAAGIFPSGEAPIAVVFIYMREHGIETR